MAVFVNDTFTDTNGVLLQNHTGETGATWTEHPDVLNGTDATIQSNKASSLANGIAYYASGSPATAEYDVELTTGVLSSATIGQGPQGRLLTTPYTSYLAWAASALYLYKTVAGAFTELGSYGGAVASGTVIKLQIRDATKKVFLDGVERISSTNNDVTGAGKAGVRFYSDGTVAAVVDTFSATDATTGSIASSSGIAAVAGVGASVATTTGASNGIGAASAVGLGATSSVGAAAGSGTASGVGASTVNAVGSSAGVATVSGIAPAEAGSGVGSSSGTATVSGVGASIVAAVGTSSGGASVSGVSGNGAIITPEEISYAPQRKTRAPNFAPRKEPAKPEAKKKTKAKPAPKPEPRNRLRMANELIMPDTMLDLMQKRREQQAIERQHLYNIRARAALLAA